MLCLWFLFYFLLQSIVLYAVFFLLHIKNSRCTLTRNTKHESLQVIWKIKLSQNEWSLLNTPSQIDNFFFLFWRLGREEVHEVDIIIINSYDLMLLRASGEWRPINNFLTFCQICVDSYMVVKTATDDDVKRNAQYSERTFVPPEITRGCSFLHTSRTHLVPHLMTSNSLNWGWHLWIYYLLLYIWKLKKKCIK